MDAPAAAEARRAPLAARAARAAVLFVIAAGPALWLLGAPLARSGAVPGAPSAGIYGALHAYWAATTAVPPRHPEAAAPAPVDALAQLLAPLTAAIGPSGAVIATMLGGLAATLAVTWTYARRHAADPWTAAAATASFTASPAVVAGVASGELDAWQGWAVLAPALVSGPAALACGVAAAVVAPTLVPAAFVPALHAAWRAEGRGGYWPLAGLALGVALRSVLGWPTFDSAAGWDAWFAYLELPPSPERYGLVYVGFVAAALLAAGLARTETRAFALLGAAALGGSLVNASLPPERLLLLVPLYAALAGLPALRAALPAHGAALAVLAATALVGEGWKGVSAAVPLATATLADPAPVAQIAEGPVLDLPATRGGVRRALWFQTRHGQPVAVDFDGRLSSSAATVARGLVAGVCSDPAALGFRTVVARREGALRELAPLRACLGEPAWDDGAVAVWRFAPSSAPPPDAAPPASPATPRPGPPAPGR